MPRALPEWIGKNDDEQIPPRVKVRVFDRCNGRCVNCGLAVVGSLRPHYDHIRALANGGENRETNLQLLCNKCHPQKSRQDVAEKSAIYKKRLKHLGIKRRKGKPMIGSRDSGWKKTFSGGWVKR